MDIKKRFVLLLLLGSIFTGTGFAFAAPAWLQPEVRTAALRTVTINNGAASTNNANVNLIIGADGDVLNMSFSNNGALWSAWEPYAVTTSWLLSAGDGFKVVWARSISSTDAVSAPVLGSIFLDTVVPAAPVTGPDISTNGSKTEVFKVSWPGADPAPSSGIVSYDVVVKTNAAGAWTAFRTAVAPTSAYFTGAPGNAYHFRARARDNAGNTGPWSPAKRTIVPYDQDSAIVKRVGFGGAISKASSNLYLGTARYSTTKGDTITYSFTGNYFALIGTKGPKYSKAVVIIDGVKKTIDAKAATKKFRRVLIEKNLTMKTHTVKIKNLGTPGRRRFEIDGNAVGR